jgi:hypothetical protein
MAARQIFCPQCGVANSPHSKFCAQCGAAIQRAVRSTVDTPAALHSAIPKPSKHTIWPAVLGLWPLLFIVIGVIAYLTFGKESSKSQNGGVALVYAGLLAGLFKLGASSWRKTWKILQGGKRASLPEAAKLPWQSARSCAGSIAIMGVMLVATSFIFIKVAEEVTSQDIPDDMLPALTWAFMKPTDWIKDGLERVAQSDFSDISLPDINPFCASYDFPTGGGECYVDQNGMSMCSEDLAGAPSPSDCWTESGQHICQDANGYIINMTAVCSEYPCTPLCKTLGIK